MKMSDHNVVEIISEDKYIQWQPCTTQVKLIIYLQVLSMNTYRVCVCVFYENIL